MRLGRDAGSKKLTIIEETKNDPSLYDVVAIGTPVWNGTMSTPIRTYVVRYRESFKRVAFFCTQDGSEKKALDEMECLCGKTPIALLQLNRKQEVEAETYLQKAKQFTSMVERALS